MNLSPKRLAELAPLKNVPELDLIELSRVLHGQSVARGEVLYHEGEPARGAVILLSGRLSVTIGEGPGGRSVGDLWPGDLAGDAGLFDLTSRRNATVTAVMDSDCAVLEPDLFALLPRNQAVIALELHLLHQMARRIRAANARLEQTWRKPVAGAPGAGSPTPSGPDRPPDPGSVRGALLRILGLE